jgi:hypothetical protein
VGSILAGGLGLAGLGAVAAVAPAAAPAAHADSTPSGCQLANGVKHVIEITFDNVHFNRDNPLVPSDLEQLPALKNFIESNGTLLSNNHTPLIAHTADDVVTTLSGLYGDRQGIGISNNYDVYNSTGGVTNKSAFAYWTASGADAFPNQPYSPTVPAAGSPAASPPAPWVPFTRAGCNVGGVSTANIELENTKPDLANVFGPTVPPGITPPEVQQLNSDANSSKGQETNDYVGLAVHCAQGDAFCANAQADRGNQTTPSPTAAPDVLPNEPNGYDGFQALFGSKYLTPQLTGAANSGDNRVINGDTYAVTDSSGNLTDLNGNTIEGSFFSTAAKGFISTPGFPGFGTITASQSLAYVADMQESGVPVTYAYISDLHQFNAATNCTVGGQPVVLGFEAPLGPGDQCYEQNALAYNQAFATFFQRLADDGITPANTEFVFSADEGDHFAGANVGRAQVPTCTGTPGVALDTATDGQTPYYCSYGANQLGEVATSVHSLLNFQTGDTASFYSQPQGEAVYATGASNSPSTIRQLERDFSSLTMNDPYDGTTEPVTKWMMDPTAEQLLHFVNADPNRTPSFTVSPNPDVFFSSGLGPDSCATGTTAQTAATGCNQLNTGFAWDHGYYAPEVDTTWLGLVGPGVENLGLDGPDAAFGPNSAGNAARGLTTVPQTSLFGTWADHTDTRPTLLALVGLHDDYTGDGRVLTEVLTTPPGAASDPLFLPLAQCYKHLNSSVGLFGTDVIVADTAALKTGSGANDTPYQTFESKLQSLGAARDKLAGTIKQELWNDEFLGENLPAQAFGNLIGCAGLLLQATALAR